MHSWRKKRQQSLIEMKARHRAELLATSDLIPWSEQCLYTIGSALQNYARNREAHFLVDATTAGTSLMVLLEELESRTLNRTVPSRGANTSV